MYQAYGTIVLSTAIFVYLCCKIWIRLQLSKAKHPSLRGHSRWSRRIAHCIPLFEYNYDQFFSSDGAPVEICKTRQLAFDNLGKIFRETYPESIVFNESQESSISDIRFTNAYRVPFPYRRIVSQALKPGIVAIETSGVRIKDLDGNWSLDLTGSYGVNVFGYEFYKECMEKGYEKIKNYGPVLGTYHPLIKKNVEKIKHISGLDQVSFHMSGTEAVMQAVRLARYHTGKSHLVRFCGAYHGWWDGVQPGIGNQRDIRDVYTLSDLSEHTLKVLETRHDIACILINPLQALHPNADAANDGSLINSERSARFDREVYSQWLKKIRDICTRRSIILIFDEVFTGFRLAYRGAQEYFGIQADMVTYGKTLGGGLPVGVVCGKHHLMKRFKDDQPVNISFARGTFNSHPYVMASMHEFLTRIEDPGHQKNYLQLETQWNRRVDELNKRLSETQLPVQIANLTSIWTVLYTLPSRYNWMYQYYLRAEGVTLSWIGTGRIIMSHNFTNEDYEQVMSCFVNAARNMKKDGWWWQNAGLSNRSIKRQVLKEMLQARFTKPGGNASRKPASRTRNQPDQRSLKES